MGGWVDGGMGRRGWGVGHLRQKFECGKSAHGQKSGSGGKRPQVLNGQPPELPRKYQFHQRERSLLNPKPQIAPHEHRPLYKHTRSLHVYPIASLTPLYTQLPPLYPHTLIPLYPCTLTLLYTHTLTPLYPCTLTLVYTHTLTPLYPCTLALLYTHTRTPL